MSLKEAILGLLGLFVFGVLFFFFFGSVVMFISMPLWILIYVGWYRRHVCNLSHCVSKQSIFSDSTSAFVVNHKSRSCDKGSEETCSSAAYYSSAWWHWLLSFLP